MLPLLRFTLDLFESNSAPAPASTKAAPSPKQRQLQASPPPQHGPFEPGEALRSTITPARFAHPNASRETRIADAVVAYRFERAKRRTIGFVVGPDGLAVRAPRWTSLGEVEAAIQEKGAWILRKLQETQERQQRQEQARVVWTDGVVLPFLGGSVQVLLDPTHGFQGKGAQLVAPVDVQATTDLGSVAGSAVPVLQTLRVGLPKAASADQIRDAVQAWLMQQAKANFTRRMDHFAPLLQVQWRKLSLSSAGTRWGSASADGSIRLNWRLIHFRQPVIDYVVATN
jgi:predicted metal-dependent hydrolase